MVVMYEERVSSCRCCFVVLGEWGGGMFWGQLLLGLMITHGLYK